MENLPQKKEKLLVEAILEKSSKIEIIKSFSNTTIQKIVAEKKPTIGTLKRHHGSEKIEHAVGVLLEDLNSSFKNELSESEINELIAEITSGMNQNLSFEGIYLAFRQLKYSNSFGKLTLNKVLKSVDEHFNEITECNILINLNKHLATKESPNEERSSIKHNKALQLAEISHELGRGIKIIKNKKK